MTQTNLPLPEPVLTDLTQQGPLADLARKVQANQEAIVRAAASSRMIAGALTDTGAIVVGRGFACIHNALGDYTINFTTPFPSTPVVLVSVGQNNINAGMMIHPGHAYSGSTFSVAIYNAPGTAGEDAPWNFLAVL